MPPPRVSPPTPVDEISPLGVAETEGVSGAVHLTPPAAPPTFTCRCSRVDPHLVQQ